jgi:hypothetical protein
LFVPGPVPELADDVEPAPAPDPVPGPVPSVPDDQGDVVLV